MKTVFTAARLFTPAEEIRDPLFTVEDGVIVEVSSRSGQEVAGNTQVVDFGDAVLVERDQVNLMRKSGAIVG